MTLLIYVDTSRHVGNPEHLKVLLTLMPQMQGCRNDLEGVAFEYKVM